MIYAFYAGLAGAAAGFIDPALLAFGGYPPAVLIAAIPGALLWLGLFWLIVRGHRWARVLLFVATPLLLLGAVLRSVPNGPPGSPLAGWAMAIPTLGAAALLLTRSSRAWFASQRGHAA